MEDRHILSQALYFASCCIKLNKLRLNISFYFVYLSALLKTIFIKIRFKGCIGDLKIFINFIQMRFTCYIESLEILVNFIKIRFKSYVGELLKDVHFIKVRLDCKIFKYP